MQRLRLNELVSLSKQIAGNKGMFKNDMEIKYSLPQSEFELLQLEIYEHVNKTTKGFKTTKRFEFESMGVRFVFIKIIE